MFAAHHQLDGLTFIVDVNGLQYTGATGEVLAIEPLAEKWRAFGWAVAEIDGHDVQQVADALVPRSKDCPSVVLAKTIKGKGVSFMENALDWHGKAPSDDQLATALAELS